MELIQTVGRRKTSVARANVRKGTGKIVINNKESKDYFPTIVLHARVTQPLVKVDCLTKYDISASMCMEAESPGNLKLSVLPLHVLWWRSILQLKNHCAQTVS